MDAATEWRNRSDTRQAQLLYFGHSDEIDEDELAESGFVEWFIYDYRPRGKNPTLVEEYLSKRGERLPADQRELLESWRAARYGFYEVQRVEEGTGSELKDVFTGETFFVHDVSSSNELVQWDLMFSRIEQLQGRYLFSGNGVRVPRSMLAGIRELIETESRLAGRPPHEFVRANSHRWYGELKRQSKEWRENLKIVNAEGDPLEFSTATYAVRDEEAVANAIRALKQFEETTSSDDAAGTRRFAWLEIAEGPRRSYGNIEMANGELRLECNSRRRLEIGRQLLEKHAGSALEHRLDSFDPLHSLPAGSRPATPEKSIGVEQREVVERVKAEHYAHWADEPLPALEGKTPREAVRSAAGRRAVEELIRIIENGEERARKSGEGSFDFKEIRSLGLQE
jgi:hypothetical protein